MKQKPIVEHFAHIQCNDDSQVPTSAVPNSEDTPMIRQQEGIPENRRTKHMEQSKQEMVTNEPHS